MQDFEKLGAFYLGRVYDPVKRQAVDELLLYDSKDLVTHAVCVGMTGSGKTGLCLSLLEEAAIDSVPAIVIDPKGDLSNLLLQFPELSAREFEPWINEEEARRQGLSKEQFAEQQAGEWRAGLAAWGQDAARVQRLRASADFAIYTPGSNAGLPLSIVKSLSAPPESMMDDRETLRDRVSGTATALLSLLGIDAEPMKSREHILLANIIDAAWRNGETLSLEELIHRIQSPPFTRVGVLELESFYPSKHRFELAMSLNSLLASPGFEAWLEGEALDIARLLHTPEGKPRISIISISHLSDTERMFFVSLLLNEALAWTRTQPGTTSLRAIVYMDEIFGYFPPVANPPSKRPLLTLLKQARAFGVGIVLATQNPVDLDYKGLANAGTWFIGRLQTERDKERLIDGLEGASNESGARFDRGRIEQILAGLGKRVFLMNNVHETAPVAFESRWALSYLRGPMTRAQIRTLMESRKNAAAAPKETASPAAPAPRETKTAARMVLPPDVPQSFVPARASGEIQYQPMLLGAAQVRFTDTKAKVDFLQEKVFVTPIHDDSMPVQWEECSECDVDPNALEKEPAAQASFGVLPGAAGKAKSYTGWQKDLVTWIYSHQQLEIYRSAALKEYSSPGETEGGFRVRLQQSSREDRDRAIAKLRQKYSSRIATLQDRLRRAQQEADRQREQAHEQSMNTIVSVGTGLLGAFFGRKAMSTAAGTALRSGARAHRESMDVGRAEETMAAVEQQLAEIEEQMAQEVAELHAAGVSSEVLETVAIKPKKTNINVRLFTLAWMPFKKDAAGKFVPAWD